MYSSIPIKVHHISICIQGNFSFNACIQPTEAHHPKKFRTKPGHAQPIKRNMHGQSHVMAEGGQGGTSLRVVKDDSTDS